MGLDMHHTDPGSIMQRVRPDMLLV